MCKFAFFNEQDHRAIWDRGLDEVVERMHKYLQCGSANECGAAVDIQSRLFQLKHFKQTTQQTNTADNQEDGMGVQTPNFFNSRTVWFVDLVIDSRSVIKDRNLLWYLTFDC